MRAVKSVSIDSERRVIITYLDGSTETLYPNCIWCDSEALRQLIKDLLEDKADAITQTIENVTVATFADGADEGLIKKLLVSVDPIQEGSGDPSPENIRPISGWTGLTVYHSGADTSEPTAISVNWETEAGTVYGGTLDVVSGKLVINKVMADLGTIAWEKNPTYSGLFNGSLVPRATRVSTPRHICSIFVATDSTTVISLNNSIAISASGGTIYAHDDSYDTATDFKTAMSGVQLVYQVEKPIEIQLPTQEITTLLGDNKIWVDSGNILELEYTADTKLYIGEQQSGALGSGIQNITKPDIQPVSEKTCEDVEEAYKEETTDERGEE